MAHRSIGQERLGFAVPSGGTSSLDDLSRLINWDRIAGMLGQVHACANGEAAWPPLAMFKALLLSVWYDLSDVKLAEALDDRDSFLSFCGFSRTEATPEQTAFVRFRKALVARNLNRLLFTTVTAQLKAKAIVVKSGTLVDATIIASASESDDDARWVKHKGKPAVHGFKAHVGADADTALVEEIAVTSANINDGRAVTDALPDDPGEVFADSAIGATTSEMLFVPKAGRRASSPPACGAATNRELFASSKHGTSQSIGCGAGSRRYSGPGNEAMGFAEFDGVAWPKPPSRSTSPQSPTTSNEH
jgi:IS5 family transposase